MYEYIRGKLTEISPAHAVLENEGIGYFINITVNTFSKLKDGEFTTLYIHQIVREDANLLYGFISKGEREMFRSLILVSGIGPNTGRMMLSSLNSNEIRNAILTDDVDLLKSIKGIGAKTAQRIIIDLKDKIGKVDDSEQISFNQNNTIKEESLSALIMLGFAKKTVEKVIAKIIKEDPDTNVEGIVKKALKLL